MLVMLMSDALTSRPGRDRASAFRKARSSSGVRPPPSTPSSVHEVLARKERRSVEGVQEWGRGPRAAAAYFLSLFLGGTRGLP